MFWGVLESSHKNIVFMIPEHLGVSYHCVWFQIFFYVLVVRNPV